MRISATDWAEGPEKSESGEWLQWGIEQSTIYVDEMKKLGVDLVDVSTGGNWEQQKIPIGPGYQVCSLFCNSYSQDLRSFVMREDTFRCCA